MSEEYTPTTEEMHLRQIPGADPNDLNATEQQDLDEFYRWLRAEKATAWEKGAESAFFSWDIRGFVDYPENPYRKESQ